MGAQAKKLALLQLAQAPNDKQHVEDIVDDANRLPVLDGYEVVMTLALHLADKAFDDNTLDLSASYNDLSGV